MWTMKEETGPSLAGWYECKLGQADFSDDEWIVVLLWNGHCWTYRGRKSNWHNDVTAWRGPLYRKEEFGIE